MGEPVTLTLMAAATAISAAGQMAAASQQEAMGRAQQAQAQAQAQYTRRLAEINAQNIEREAEWNAARLEEQGVQEQASAQRAAIEANRQKRLALSSAMARQAATGGGLDPTSLNLYTTIEQVGVMEAMTALYTGDAAAGTLNTQAALTRHTGASEAEMTRYTGAAQADTLSYQGAIASYEAKNKAASMRLSAVGSAISGAADFGTKYTDTYGNPFAKKPANTILTPWGMVDLSAVS